MLGAGAGFVSYSSRTPLLNRLKLIPRSEPVPIVDDALSELNLRVHGSHKKCLSSHFMVYGKSVDVLIALLVVPT